MPRNLIHEWFRWSGSYPLSLGIFWVYQEDLIDDITSVSNRWHTVVFRMSLQEARRFAAIKSRLPLLRHFDLHLSTDYETHPIDIFGVAPLLRSLTLHSESYDPNTFLKLPWNQLI